MSNTDRSTPTTSPFVREDQMFLSDMIERLDQDTGLSTTRRRDLKSAVRAIARLVGQPVQTVPANINWLQIRVRRIHPSQHGISKKRFHT